MLSIRDIIHKYLFVFSCNKKLCFRKKHTLIYHVLSYFVYFCSGVIEILLALRLIFQLLGANLGNGFVDLIYNLSGIFIAPFTGIFPNAVIQGPAAALVFDPSSLVAMIVYGIIAWIIVMLIQAISGQEQPD